MAHTPGPWSAVEDAGEESILIGSGRRERLGLVPVAQISIGYDEPFEGEQQANARLIAAAPDMLAALKALVARDRTPDNNACAEMIAARAAIAKAEPVRQTKFLPSRPTDQENTDAV